MIENITFLHFFMDLKEMADKKDVILWNPYTMLFLKSRQTYFAVTKEENAVFVNYIHGLSDNSIDSMRDLIKLCIKDGIKTLKFGTWDSLDNKMPVFYRYIGAVKTGKIEKYYVNGQDCITFELDLQNAKRFK